MSWIWRKVFQRGPVRWTLSKKGVGASLGKRGIRIGRSPTGGIYVSVGVPGTSLYWRRVLFRADRPKM